MQHTASHAVGGTFKFSTLPDLRVSSLRRGHANLLCAVPILTDDPRRESVRESGPSATLVRPAAAAIGSRLKGFIYVGSVAWAG